MIEYLPWSKKVFDSCLNDYSNNEYAILDIELGGQCNYHCIYCDSPSRDKQCKLSLEQVEIAFQTNKIKWVFVCGLGEPTAMGNLPLLLKILGLCKIYGAKCSIFTNLSLLNEDLEEFIKCVVLNILFKYDSSDIQKTMSLYGVPNVNKQIFNIERIKELVQVHDGCTNIGASIVPTQVNKEDILDIVRDCLNHNIYPLIAELENSGDAQDYYKQLALSHEELQEIKTKVNELIGEEYVVPVCPSVICGVHIRHDGYVTVDETTGLSCHWFWLEEPKTHVIGNFKTDNFSTLVFEIEKYRKERKGFVENLLSSNPKRSVFGGCGGDAFGLLTKYLKIQGGK